MAASLKISSPHFKYCGQIPSCYKCEGDGITPTSITVIASNAGYGIWWLVLQRSD